MGALRTAICIPWRAGNYAREEALSFVREHYEEGGFSITLADANTQRFSRTAARNEAARKAGDWDVAAFVDADCVLEIETLEHAFQQAWDEQQVILPHDHYYPLGRLGTTLALRETNIGAWHRSWIEQPFVDRKRPSGVIVFPRMAWEIVGGYDERFTGWGFEDTAMLFALTGIAGGWSRASGVLWHLWHPPSNASWEPEDKALFERYKRAVDDQPAMRALLRERTAARMTA